MRNKRFEIANIPFSFLHDSFHITDWPNPFYFPFQTQKPELIRIQTRRLRNIPSRASFSDLRFDGGAHWRLFENHGQFEVHLFDPKTKAHDRTARISPDFTEVELIHWKKSHFLNWILRPLAEILLVHYLASREGLLVHAAAVRDGDQAYLFVGRSGAGKTTISTFWAGVEGDVSVLGDERLVVRREAGEWFAYGTPWPGMGFRCNNERVRISRVFFIRHGSEHEIIEQGPALYFNELFTQVFSSFWNLEALDQITRTCQKAVEEIPCRLLAFAKAPDVTGFVRNFNCAAQP